MKIFLLNCGTFNADGGAMFGTIPKRYWEKQYPSDDNNFCRLAMYALLIDTGKKLIIVDSGVGKTHLHRLKFYQFEEVIDFDTTLQQLGYSTNKVTDVILTHLHFDHYGGCINGNHLTFPNATHWISEKQWINALHPNLREKDAIYPEDIALLEKSGKIQLLENDFQFSSEISLQLYDGHSTAQITPTITYPRGQIIFAGDVIPVIASVQMDWISAYDTHPIRSIHAKKVLLDKAYKNRSYIISSHDIYSAMFTVKGRGKNIVVDKIVKFEAGTNGYPSICSLEEWLD